MKHTVGEILDIVGDGSIQFDEIGYPLICDSQDGNGNWIPVKQVTPYGLLMQNGETWEFSKLTQGEINLIYDEIKNVINDYISWKVEETF